MKDNYTLITEYPEKGKQIKEWEKQLGIKGKTKGCDYGENAFKNGKERKDNGNYRN